MALLGVCKPTGKPAWSRDGSIGDYGGATDKRASDTEADTPYAYAVYKSLQSPRGSAYSQETSGTLVHCENLSLARTLSAVWYRGPEKLRANMTPGRSDERLEYWATVLGIPFGPNDQRWQVRQRCAAHYQATRGPTLQNVTDAVTALLGDAFVSITTTVGSDLATPPDVTYWPGINAGPSTYSLGGGAWLSTRCHMVVNVSQPSGMSDGEFLQLTNVQLFQLLDRMLPIWATFNWSTNATYGFLVGVSRIGFDGLA